MHSDLARAYARAINRDRTPYWHTDISCWFRLFFFIASRFTALSPALIFSFVRVLQAADIWKPIAADPFEQSCTNTGRPFSCRDSSSYWIKACHKVGYHIVSKHCRSRGPEIRCCIMNGVQKIFRIILTAREAMQFLCHSWTLEP